MRLPRPRFTIRWMMVAVAIVGVVLGAERFLIAGLIARHTIAGEPSWQVVIWEWICINAIVVVILKNFYAPSAGDGQD